MAKDCDTTDALDLSEGRRQMIARLEELRREFISLYTERDHLLSYVRDDLYIRYLNLLGRMRYENFRLSVEIKALRLKVELAQAALNHNRRPVMASIDAEVKERMSQYRRELKRQAEELERVQQSVGISDFSVSELRSLYHTLARRLHPDLHPDLSDDLRDIFVQGVAAYRSFDLPRLRELVKRLEMDAPAFDGMDNEESLSKAVARLERDTADMKEKIRALRLSFPFNLEEKLMDPVWVNERRKELEDERRSLTDRKRMFEERLELLTSL